MIYQDNYSVSSYRTLPWKEEQWQ